MLALVVVRLVAAAGAAGSTTARWFLRALRAGGAARLHRRARRLDDDRSRPPALDGLRPAAHRRFGVAVADRARRAALAARLRRGLSDHLSGRRRCCMARIVRAGPPATGRERRRSRAAGRDAPVRPCRRQPEGGGHDAPLLDLVPIWTLILGVGVFFYVLLDGFDLGVGILFGFAPDTPIAQPDDELDRADLGRQRDLAGARRRRPARRVSARLRDHHAGGLLPDPVMLLALIFRGVAFEFRYRDAEHRTFWDHGFCYGSALATFAQGVVLGAFIQGFQVEGRHFAGSSFDCFTPFSLLDRRRPGVRLCAARRRLADPQDRGRAAGLGARARAGAA